MIDYPPSPELTELRIENARLVAIEHRHQEEIAQRGEIRRLQQANAALRSIQNIRSNRPREVVINPCQEAVKQAKEALAVLRLIADRHDGYNIGAGPCVCEGHIKARVLLDKET